MTNTEAALKLPLIIGIAGKAGSGKDTFADLIVSEFKAIKIPFAKAVKDEVEDFLKQHQIFYTRENLWGSQEDKEKEFLIVNSNLAYMLKSDSKLYSLIYRFGQQKMDGILLSYRTLLQFWGTEYRRAQDDDYWVKKAFSQCKNKEIYVLSDVRFPNEYKALTTPHPMFKGYSVKIIGRKSNISGMEHSSETALDDETRWNYTIVNNRSYDEFLFDCRIVIKDILKKEEICLKK